MEKTATEGIGKFSHHPRLAAIVTASFEEKDNAMTAAWHSSIYINLPIYSVSTSPKRFTYQLISQSKEFGINFILAEKAHLAASVGGNSGQKIDKFQKLNISKEKPIKTSVPLLKDAYVSCECKLLDSKIYGDHV